MFIVPSSIFLFFILGGVKKKPADGSNGLLVEMLFCFLACVLAFCLVEDQCFYPFAGQVKRAVGAGC